MITFLARKEKNLCTYFVVHFLFVTHPLVIASSTRSGGSIHTAKESVVTVEACALDVFPGKHCIEMLHCTGFYLRCVCCWGGRINETSVEDQVHRPLPTYPVLGVVLHLKEDVRVR